MLNISISGVSPLVRAGAFVFPERKPSNSPRLRLVEQGSTLALENTHPFEAFRIVEGCICLSLSLADGRRQILDVLGPGRLVSAHLASINGCSAIALIPTRLRTLDLASVRHTTIDALQQMLWRAQSHAALLGRKTMTERVAVALLDLAGQFAVPPGKPARGEITFPLHLTRADLADWLGLTLSSVSRCLNAFKRHGLIAFDNPKLITIRDRDALAALASGISVSAYPSQRRSPRAGFNHASHCVAPAADRQAS